MHSYSVILYYLNRSIHFSILLNGVPGKQFSCLRGVRQGDPLSPLLFVIAADLLQLIINRAFNLNLLGLPIPNGDEHFPIVQYADDTLIVMQASSFQLLCLKALLESFHQATGLRVNYSKSCLIPINVYEQKTQILAGTLGCSVGKFPLTYLGLPVGTTRSKLRELMPIINRIDRRLASCSSFLSFGGRLQVVKSVFSALPAYTLSIFKVQDGFIEAVDKRRRIALWNKSEITGTCKSLAAWDKVCAPKACGGLVVLNLSVIEAQMVKFLHKFYNKTDTPWVKILPGPPIT